MMSRLSLEIVQSQNCNEATLRGGLRAVQMKDFARPMVKHAVDASFTVVSKFRPGKRAGAKFAQTRHQTNYLAILARHPSKRTETL